MLFYLLFCLYSVAFGYHVEKVFGGRYANDGEFPFVVSISGKKICAGSLVTLAKVVTAAHCLAVFGQNKEIDVHGIYVIGGSVNISSLNREYEQRKIESVLLFDKYQPGSRYNGNMDTHDIGLALLDHPFHTNKYLKIMNLISWNATIFRIKWNEIVAKKTVCYAMGWGKTKHNSLNMKESFVARKFSPILKVIEVYPVEGNSCFHSLSPDLDMTMESEACAYSVKHETVCDGDSGGPLVCDGRPYGLLTYGPGCGSERTAQRYLLFGYYLDFLTLSATSLFTPKPLIFFLIYIVFSFSS